MFSFKKFLQKQPRKAGDLKPRTQFAKNVLKKKGATGHDVLQALDAEHEKDLERTPTKTKTGKIRKPRVTAIKRWSHAELATAQDDPNNQYFKRFPHSTFKEKQPIEPIKPKKSKGGLVKGRVLKAWQKSNQDLNEAGGVSYTYMYIVMKNKKMVFSSQSKVEADAYAQKNGGTVHKTRY